MEDKEILKLIAKKYPDGFPETEEDFKCLTREQVIGIFLLGYEVGKEEAEQASHDENEPEPPHDMNDLD